MNPGFAKKRERIDIDGAFSSIKTLQLDVIDGLRASIKQLAMENQKIQKERADFKETVQKLRKDFESDYSTSLTTLRNINKFVDEKITASNELLQNQIGNLEQSFSYKLAAFEQNTINAIQAEQTRLGKELQRLTARVDSVKLSSGSLRI
ncbi:Oidioi.mRNA.OKI2018_I69.XSR.g17033.t1.cds [Oikopleura dioica]|uniref:Oidioi.mRNA.OKI2018_I69.XSR.g17033.t1.cds n=1 Tax=Oikopleura dioica TaxID=34765 RepID=A0ABN7SN28_OIKDI|nr:Oidioi.mRNA.OKI2018_I69.XSR.g17033.t1.cds [Oikopleura dioica]